MKLYQRCSFFLAGLLVAAAGAAPARAEAPPAWPESTSIRAPEKPTAPGRRASESRSGAVRAPAETGHRYALGVNLPTGWFRDSFGASVSVGLTRHRAVRASVIRYNADPLVPNPALSASGGAMFDVSLGWVYFPRRLWDGFMFEAGALRRERAVREYREDDDTFTQSVTYGGRAMIGWSWSIARRGFISAAVGLSAGRETGQATVTPEDWNDMSTIRPLDRLQVDAELQLRFGIMFGR